MTDEGSNLDRLDRMEKRAIIETAVQWQELRQLHNAIVHDYLIEASDRVVTDALKLAPVLFETFDRLVKYAKQKGFVA